VIDATTPSTALAESAFDKPVRLATAATRSFLFNGKPPLLEVCGQDGLLKRTLKPFSYVRETR